MKKSGALIALAALVVIGGGAFALTRGGDKGDNTTSGIPPTTKTEPPASTPSTDPRTPDEPINNTSIEITYSDSGFSPASSTAESGAKVTVKNTSSRKLEFASDPHPVHTTNPQLNIGSIAPGDTTTFTVTKSGTWGYHNHLHASDTGTLIVK